MNRPADDELSGYGSARSMVATTTADKGIDNPDDPARRRLIAGGVEGAAPTTIGRGRVITTGAEWLVWRSNDGELTVTDVNTGAQWDTVKSDSSRMGAFMQGGPAGEGSMVAVVDHDELIVWDNAGNAKRYAQRNVMFVKWISAIHLLIICDDQTGEVLDVSRDEPLDTLAVNSPEDFALSKLEFFPSAIGWLDPDE
jgi:hypothetical protein